MAVTTKTSDNIAIVWGSSNAVNTGLKGTLIDSMSLTPKNGAPVDIETGEGLSAIQVLIGDGFDGRAKATYDSNIAALSAGANIVVVAPKTDGNAGTANLNATFWSWSYTRSKKNPAEIEIVFTNRPGMN